MGKLAGRDRKHNVPVHGGYAFQHHAQLEPDPDVLGSEPGDGGDLLRDERGQGSVDVERDDAPVQRSKRSREDHRDVSDEELVKQVSIKREWGADRMAQILGQVAHTGLKWDDSAAKYPMELMIEQAHAAQESTYILGDYEGAVMFYPINPGIDAMVHFYIWSRRWLRRPRVMRAILRDAFKRWDLKRVTEMIPESNKLGCRNAERIGFTLEGEMRKQVWHNEGGCSMRIYGLLREEIE